MTRHSLAQVYSGVKRKVGPSGYRSLPWAVSWGHHPGVGRPESQCLHTPLPPGSLLTLGHQVLPLGTSLLSQVGPFYVPYVVQSQVGNLPSFPPSFVALVSGPFVGVFVFVPLW